MEPEIDKQRASWDEVPEPVGYLAGILERLKTLGPPPPRANRGPAPGSCVQEP